MKKLLTCLLAVGSIYAQNKPYAHKSITAHRNTLEVKIDGDITDPAWAAAPLLKDFTLFRPVQNKPEDPNKQTEARMMYSDEGIYFAGTCFEPHKDSITTELKGRDGFGANDFFGVILDTYNDKINGFEYFVTPLNEQWDSKLNDNVTDGNSEDFSWNAVWQSATKVHDKGWDFEIFIPFSAIRFSKNKEQTWGFNLTRRRQKSQEQSMWNPIDINLNGFLTQSAKWVGLKDIQPPVRFQLFPYISTYQSHFPAQNAGEKPWANQTAGGMDLKWGLNQAFTLDATLIPDFGQVQSDDRVLNLTPFEVKYNEYRTFFTEGTELFNKANLFYSRRIGGSILDPSAVDTYTEKGYSVKKMPTNARLLNATKISGRNQKGLGVGILNAVTQKQFATLVAPDGTEELRVEVDPNTNFNILVLDQTLKNNSNISFVNQSVLRSGGHYNSNVSLAQANISNKKNTYNFSGYVSTSYLDYKDAPDMDNSLGYQHQISYSKTSGKFQFGVNQELTDTRYNNNDLGYFTNNNYINHGTWFTIRKTEPKGWYNRMFINWGSYTSHLYKKIGNNDKMYQFGNIRVNLNAQTKKLIWFGANLNFSPEQHDYYEPRVAGLMYTRGKSLGYGGWVETNNGKKYYVNLSAFRRSFINFYNLTGSDMQLEQSYRFNSKFTATAGIEYSPRKRGLGFTKLVDDNTPLFATRNVQTFSNTMVLKYNFNNKMGLNFRARHYYSNVVNKEYFNLAANGSLVKNITDTNPDLTSQNYFNIDMVYTWQYAPGSFLNVVWKNSTSHNGLITDNYISGLQNTLVAPQLNTLSVRLIHYLDYGTLRKAFASRKA